MMNSLLMLFMPSLASVPAQIVHDDLPRIVPSQQQINGLINDLSTGSVNTRIHAISVLGQEKIRESVPHLISLLKDTNPHVRAEAATALGQIKIKNSAPRLYQLMLNDTSPLVRARATLALADLDYNGALPAVFNSLDRPDIRERMAAVRALGKFGGPKAFNYLMRLLRSGNPELRETVIEALGDLGDRKVVRYLFRYLDQGTAQQNRAALLALTRLHPQMVQKKLPSLLKRSETEVVTAALDSAAQVGCPKCIPQILHLVENADDPIAAHAAGTAATLNIEEAIEPIHARLLPRPNLQSRMLYLWSLGRLGAPSVIPEAMSALREPMPELRLTALRVLRIVRPAGLELESVIYPLVGDTTPSVAAEAILLLGEYGNPGWMESRFPEPGSPLRLGAALASLAWMHPVPSHRLPDLRIHARSESTPLRNAAISTLGRLRDTASAPMLLKSVYSSDSRLRWEAVRALALIRDDDSRGTLVALASRDAHSVVRAYAMLGALSMKGSTKSLENTARLRHEERMAARDYAEAFIYALALAQSGKKDHVEAFQKVFELLLFQGTNSSQKAEFVDLLFLFGEKWATSWMEKALESPLIRVRSRAMVWKARFLEMEQPAARVATNPVEIPHEETTGQLQVPFQTQDPGSGCGCRTGSNRVFGPVSLVFLFSFVLLRRKRRL